MENQTNENIEKLFGEFLPDQDSRQAAEDVRETERILREHPAPAPAGRLLADINSKVAEALAAKRAKTRRLTVYKMAAAAVVIIFIAIGAKFFVKGPAARTPVTLEPIKRVVWESDGVSPGQTDLALLTGEIERVESEILTLRLGEGGKNGSKESIELEVELTDIGGDFWKG